MRGFAAGSSQRSNATRSDCGRLTHPSVELPLDWCRKMPDPRPGVAGMLYRMTAKYVYCGLICHSGSLGPPGFAPWWNVL